MQSREFPNFGKILLLNLFEIVTIILFSWRAPEQSPQVVVALFVNFFTSCKKKAVVWTVDTNSTSFRQQFVRSPLNRLINGVTRCWQSTNSENSTIPRYQINETKMGATLDYGIGHLRQGCDMMERFVEI